MNSKFELEISIALLEAERRFELPPHLEIGVTPSVDLLLKIMPRWSKKSITRYAGVVATHFKEFAENWPYQALGRKRLKDHQKARIYERLVREYHEELMLRLSDFKGFCESADLDKFLKMTSRRYNNVMAEKSLLDANLAGRVGGNDWQGVYIDPNTARLVFERRAANNEYLEKKEVLKGGKKFRLPTIEAQEQSRLNETISVIKALEEFATEQGKVFAMLTLTAPPNFHPSPQVGRSSWNQRSVRLAHEHIKGNWNLLKAKLNKQGFVFGVVPRAGSANIFGIRVTEPHKDATPHWHVMLFLERCYLDVLEAAVRDIWCWHDKAFDVIRQDEARTDSASAASYLTKYLMKTYDQAIGGCEDVKLTADEAYDSLSYRVMAWRKALRLRAYQPIGLQGLMAMYRAARGLPSLSRQWANVDLSNFLSSYTSDHQGDDLIGVMSVGLLAAIRAAHEGLAWEVLEWCDDGSYKGYVSRYHQYNAFGSFYKLYEQGEKLVVETPIGDKEVHQVFGFETVETNRYPITQRVIVRDERVTLLVSHTAIVADAKSG